MRRSQSLLGLVGLILLIFGGLALYFTGALWWAWEKEIYTSIPYLLLFQVGFLYVGITSVLQGWFKLGSGNATPIAPIETELPEQAQRAA